MSSSPHSLDTPQRRGNGESETLQQRGVREVDGTVQRVDGSSGKLLATIATDAADNFGGIVVGGGFVWTNSRVAPVSAGVNP